MTIGEPDAAPLARTNGGLGNEHCNGDDNPYPRAMGANLDAMTAMRRHVAPTYRLRLYIAGGSARSRQALRTVTSLAERYLGDETELEVIDIYQQPGRAHDDDVVAVPTLIRDGPPPRLRVYGDLSDESRIRRVLELDVGSTDGGSTS